MKIAHRRHPLEKNTIGNTELKVTSLGLGCLGLGRAHSDEQAIHTFQKAINQGINYFDTAPTYFRGKSERRIGKALTDYSGEKLVISTKVGWTLNNTYLIRARRLLGESPPRWRPDYSRKAVLKNLEGSLQRLGVEAVDIVFIHDPDNPRASEDQAINEAYPTLAELRDDGVIKAIGAGMDEWEMELRFAQECDFDCFLLAGRYTLLEQGALDAFLPYCEKHKISVIIGAPYNSGVLADPINGRYKYKAAPSDIVAKAQKLQEICNKHRVSLKAAALQFVIAHPAVASVIPGTSNSKHQEENYKMMCTNIPMELWTELINEGLIDQNSPVPNAGKETQK